MPFPLLNQPLNEDQRSKTKRQSDTYPKRILFIHKDVDKRENSSLYRNMVDGTAVTISVQITLQATANIQ